MTKDNQHGINPTIYGRADDWFIDNRIGDISVTIDSVDLHEVLLMVMTNKKAKIVIEITNSSIFLQRPQVLTKVSQKVFSHEEKTKPFLHLQDHQSSLNIKIQKCVLKSPYIIEKAHDLKEHNLYVDTTSWLNVKLSKGHQPLASHIEIVETVISGGSFSIENVQTFHMSKCWFEITFQKCRGLL